MILYCENCKEYCLESKCPVCGSKTINKKPARFNKRRDYSKQRLKSKGLL